jgi:hypothetical protein
MNRIDKIAGKMVKAQGTTVWGFTNTPPPGVELAVDIYRGTVQVGFGGEWWSGKLAPRMMFHHRKESVDPAYRPVEVMVRDDGYKLVFRVTGGFLGQDAAYLTMSMA